MKQLSEEVIEEGHATTFVLEVVRDIRQKRNDSRKALVELAAAGEVPHARLAGLAGKVAAYEDVLKTIAHPEGNV